MAAVKRDFIIEQGASWIRSLLWRTGLPALPVDLSGHKARMHIRATPTSTDVLVSLTTANGRIELGGSTGLITLSLSADDTTQLDIAALTVTGNIADGVGVKYRGLCAYYDLEIVREDPSGDVVTRLAQGRIGISTGVTR